MRISKPLATAGVVLILALGIFFRLEGLGKKVFWHDEIFTKFFSAGYQSHEWEEALFTGNIVAVQDLQKYLRFNADRTLSDTITGLIREDPHHPPLFYMLARIWVGAFGDSIANLRLLSALLSFLAFPAIYWLSLELFPSKRAAWTAVALLAVSPFFVLYAQEAREYSLWSALILSSNAALLWAIRLSGESDLKVSKKIFAWGIFSLLTVVSLYISFSTSLVILAQSLYLLIREKFRFNKIIWSFGAAMSAALLLFLPWMLVLKDHLKTFSNSTAWARDIVIPRFDLFKTLAMNIAGVFFDFGHEYSYLWTYFAVYGILALLFFGIYSLCRNAPLKTSAWILTLSLVPILMLLTPDLIFGGIRSTSARYLTASLLTILLILSYLLAVRLADKKIGALLTGFLLTLGILSCIHNAKLDTAWTKGINQNLRQIAAPINASVAPLVVGNQKGYNPASILALSYLIKPEVKLQLLSSEEAYTLPTGFSEVFLFDPSDALRAQVERQSPSKAQLVFQDRHLSLWKVTGR